MIIRLTFLLFALFACSQCVFAQPEKSVNLKENENSITLDNTYLYFMENRSMESFTPEKFDVKKLRFSILNNKIPNFGFIQHDVWFYFIINNQLSSAQTRFLSLNNPNLDIAELHFSDSTGRINSLDQGDLIAQNKHLINSRKIAFKLTLPAQSKREFYLRVNNGGEQFHFYPELQTHDRFFEHQYSKVDT